MTLSESVAPFGCAYVRQSSGAIPSGAGRGLEKVGRGQPRSLTDEGLWNSTCFHLTELLAGTHGYTESILAFMELAVWSRRP